MSTNLAASQPGYLPGEENLLEMVLSSANLPTLPLVASEVVTLTSKEDTTLADVGELVSRDVALTSKILKVANSPFYSFPQRIGSIQQAVSMMGTNAVKSLVLSFSLLSIKQGGAASKFDFDKFWEQSIGAALCAKLIVSKLPNVEVEEVFVVGLLQNLGQLVMACTAPEDYDKVLQSAEENPDVDILEIEKGILGSDHCFLGYEVARHWNFPSSISQPILHHHDPASYKGSDEQVRRSISAIYLSRLLLKVLTCTEQPEKYCRQFQTEARQLLKLSSADVDAILDEVHIELDSGAENFGVKLPPARPVQEILQEANIRLSLLNLDYHQMNKELIQAKVALEIITEELQEKNELLKSLADKDGLTGVYNNRYFQGVLDRELSRTERQGYQLSLLLIDIDHFKRFNDKHGHLVGDFVLAEFAQLLGEHLRDYDILARYGGEEFVVVLPETDCDEAVAVASKLCAVVENHEFRDEEYNRYRVTASFGVSTKDGTSEDDLGKNEMIKMADEALYDAKKNGRNRVCTYAAKATKKGWFKRR